MSKSGIRIVYNRLPELAARAPAAVGQIVRETALSVEGEAKRMMAEPKSGRVYVVSKTGAGHQASAPGEAPAIDTGALVNSIRVEMTSQTSATVGTNMEYAAALEFGRADGHIAARPFLRPAAHKAQARFLERLKRLEGLLR